MVLNIIANNKKRGKLATIFSQEPKNGTRKRLLKRIWGQSYKFFYTLGQIYKRVLKHVNNAM